MNIYPPERTKLVYTAKEGLQACIDKANEYLIIGETYEVDFIDACIWYSEVYLVGYSKGFNTVLFEEETCNK